MGTMDTPRKTKLYNEIAKDYQPKQAEMKICKYIEDLESRHEARIATLEHQLEELRNTGPNQQTLEAARKEAAAAAKKEVEAALKGKSVKTDTSKDKASTPVSEEKNAE